MKRDMDLVREILIFVSECDESVDACVFVNDNYDLDMVLYTIYLMLDAGFINANISKAFGGKYLGAEIISLTWEGHEFLDNIKSDKVWEQVKKSIAKTSKSASLYVFKKLAEKIILENILN